MQKTQKILKRILLIVFALGPLFALNSVSAQSSAGLVASPPYLSETVGEGAVIEEDFRITNHRSSPEYIYMVSREVGIDENGEYYTPPGFGKNSPSSFEQRGWLTFEPKQFLLNRGESQVVNVKIKIPEGLPTKGYYLELAVTTELPEETEERIGVAPEIAIPIAINYMGAGDVVKSLEIVSFEPDHFLYEYPPVSFTTIIANRGNVHLVPAGQVFISKDEEFKDNHGTLDLNSGGKIVFADAGRKFENQWGDGFIVIGDDGKLRVEWDKLTKFRIGKYHAQLTVIWDGSYGKEYLTATTSFWIFPWKLFLIILLIILLILAIILYRRWRRRGVRKYMA